jgi:hypothetical protein
LGQPFAIFVLKLIDTINDADEARDVCYAAGIPIDAGAPHAACCALSERRGAMVQPKVVTSTPPEY